MLYNNIHTLHAIYIYMYVCIYTCIYTYMYTIYVIKTNVETFFKYVF